MSPETVTLSDAGLFSLIAAALVLACAFLLDSNKTLDRVVFGSIVIVMIGNYLLFRISDTLPQFEWSAYAIWPRIYLAFETIIVFYTILSIVFFFKRSDRTAEANDSQRRLEEAAGRGEAVPGVDVFICTYNEDLLILERTILAAKAIDYPNFTVYVLDDGNRDWLGAFCAKVGAHHITRADNKGAKGGNLNNGLARSAEISNAPFVLILDADFAPQSPILKRTVGQFADETIGVVQTPQFYYNADPVQHNLLAKDAWVDDQRIFFDVMQPSKDAWGAAFCVGTSCVVRRSALDLIGGMPHETVTEDIHLTYRLLQKGLKTRWLNERLSVGLSAESLSGYITQRCRWCLGTIQVALLKDGPFRGPGYSFTARLHYFHGLLFWFCRPFILMLLAAPILYYFMGLPAILMEPAAFFLYALPTVAGMWIFHAWVSGRRSLPLFTEVSQMVVALPITVAIAHAIARPFGRPFKVTAKGEDRSKVQVIYPLALTFFAIIVLTFIGMLRGPILNTHNDLDAFSIAWGLIVMVYAFVSLLVCIELPRPAAEDVRFPLNRATRIAIPGMTEMGRVTSISPFDAVLQLERGALSEKSTVGDTMWFSPFDGLILAGRVLERAADAHTVRVEIVATCERNGAVTYDAAEIRHMVIGWLFSKTPINVAPVASLGRALASLLRRMFGRAATLIRTAAPSTP